MILTIITFIIVLGILVFAHELGHFFVARKFGVKAEEFGFGFPPRLFGIYHDADGKWKKVAGNKEVIDAKGTVYSLNLIPIGGFVKIKGEDGGGESEPDSFGNRKIWQRSAILSAGVAMNIILAAILISIGFMIGMPQAIDGEVRGAVITDKKIQVMQVLPDSPALQAGIMIGDVIAGVDGTEFMNNNELQNYADKNTGKELKYKIKRGQEEIELNITPTLIKETGKGGIGIAITEIGIVKYSFFNAIWQGIRSTLAMTWMIILAFYELIKNIFTGHGVSADLGGPVAIAVLTGQVAKLGFVYLLQFTAILSINLAVINFLPIPALDGGRVIFLFIEKIRRKPVKKEVEAVIHNIGFALLMLLVVVVTFRDVLKFSGLFKGIWDKIF